MYLSDFYSAIKAYLWSTNLTHLMTIEDLKYRWFCSCLRGYQTLVRWLFRDTVVDFIHSRGEEDVWQEACAASHEPRTHVTRKVNWRRSRNRSGTETHSYICADICEYLYIPTYMVWPSHPASMCSANDSEVGGLGEAAIFEKCYF